MPTRDIDSQLDRDGCAAPSAADQPVPFSPAVSVVALRCVSPRAPDLLLLDEPTNHLDAESVPSCLGVVPLASWARVPSSLSPTTVTLDHVAGWIARSTVISTPTAPDLPEISRRRLQVRAEWAGQTPEGS